MSKFSRMWIGATAALALSSCGGSQNTAATQAPPPAAPVVDQAAEAAKARFVTQAANEKVVDSFYKMPGVPPERMALISPDYVDHDPAFMRFAELNNLNARDAFMQLVAARAKLRVAVPRERAHGPQPPANNLLYKVMADGDLVTVIHETYVPDPNKKGMFYPTYGFDTWRLQDGKLVERWSSAPSPTNGPLAILEREPLTKIHFPKPKK